MSGPNTRRVRLSPHERRRQLIALGAAALGDHTLEDISIDEIAQQAGISRGLIFHYFATEQEFHEAIARHVSGEFLAATMPDRTLPPGEMLRDSIERYVGYIEGHFSAYEAILRGTAGNDPGARTLIEDTRAAVAQRIVAELPIAHDDPNRPFIGLAVRGWIAFVEETILGWIRDRAIAREKFIDLLVQSLPALVLGSPVAMV
ncbi:TetR/AcrR family transcriptional regulator [Nocardia pseudobrasiliensis]|uniref:TetR family transcriptional regulator n=1 Tax=Nocardia pseudobrasiliensis TaxID=45979 RepID=A0A370HZY0_9NOCA|nr:TetR/AcrR family transcriptional regulator [Nocardia pseudobrasiliensis]RDI64055.1 TetR family transcriptional regulator [Nocardia pseudobrasiliensis]